MQEIDELHNEISQALDTLESKIQAINKKDYSQRPKAVQRCENQAAEINQSIEAFSVEIYRLDLGKTQSATYEQALRRNQERLEMILEQLEFKKKERETEGTLIGEIMKREVENEENGGLEMIHIGGAVQNKGTNSLMRTLKKIMDADKIADEVSIELQRQLEKIEGITETVTETRREIKTAGWYIRYFAKQAYKDKLISCLIILCLIACLVIVILTVIKGGSTSGDVNSNQMTGIDQ